MAPGDVAGSCRVERSMLRLVAPASLVAAMVVACSGASSSTPTATPDGTCGTSCVDTSRHPEHCGGCGVACAAGSLCLAKACAPQVGTGESCADPLLMRVSKQDEAFTLAGATADEAPLSCGDPQKRPDRTFRWTATADHSVAVKVLGGLDTDDLVVELFSDSSCTAASSVSCNNDKTASVRRPEVDFQGKAGKTYFIVVSSFGAPPLGRFYLHVDD